MLDTEQKFMKDKGHFNLTAELQMQSADRAQRSEVYERVHLGAINAPTAWNTSTGQSTRIAIFDSGCQASNADLNGKTQKGYNATTFWRILQQEPVPIPLEFAGASEETFQAEPDRCSRTRTFVAPRQRHHLTTILTPPEFHREARLPDSDCQFERSG